MCATYVTNATKKALEESYGFLFSGDWISLDERITPFKMAPVIYVNPTSGTSRSVVEGAGPESVTPPESPLLRSMQFSLIPAWSKEAKPKFATFNARIEDIETKPTWKDSFRRHHCIVPMTAFIEPIYTGEFSGNMVTFSSKEILHAAGIYNFWVDPATGEEIASFALIMTDGLEFVKATGHARSPIFLTGTAAQEWLRNENKNPAKLKEFLLANLVVPSLTVDIDRAMAKGWEKRIPK